MKKYEFIGHTADVRLVIEGDTKEELFTAALLGMNELMKKGECADPGDGQPTITEEIEVSAPDFTALLVDFMSTVLTMSHQYKAVFCDVVFSELSDDTLKAKIMGREVEQFDEDIKAATYHEADVRENEAGNLQTTIVFDI
ncbi:archease [Patescibacteria group bacterium]